MIVVQEMPWVIIVRILSRLAVLGVLNRLAMQARRRAYGYPGAGRPGTPPTVPTGARADSVKALLSAAADPARLAARIGAMAVFLAGAATLLAAGVTLSTLGPRWLGIALLTLAALSFIAGVVEGRGALRVRMRMHRRGAADRLLPPQPDGK
ncbi:MAG TPA: hypothetical protein VI316_07095 [Candidatus Dormibacteraeota bacterium]